MKYYLGKEQLALAKEMSKYNIDKALKMAYDEGFVDGKIEILKIQLKELGEK